VNAETTTEAGAVSIFLRTRLTTQTNACSIPRAFYMASRLAGAGAVWSRRAWPLERFEQVYGNLGKTDAILATAAAHHRLVWIHPGEPPTEFNWVQRFPGVMSPSARLVLSALTRIAHSLRSGGPLCVGSCRMNMNTFPLALSKKLEGERGRFAGRHRHVRRGHRTRAALRGVVVLNRMRPMMPPGDATFFLHGRQSLLMGTRPSGYRRRTEW
jgi:hypothetical protein